MTDPTAPDDTPDTPVSLPCVMTFNSNDPSGGAGLAADLTAMASASVHVLPVVCGVYVRDTTEVREHVALDEDTVNEQARCVLEDVPVQAFKVGFVGSPENLSAIAAIATDYPEVPLLTYMPDLSWWDEVEIESYLDACAELLLPQTTILVGNHSTLCRWLLPDWRRALHPGDRNPPARPVHRQRTGHAPGRPRQSALRALRGGVHWRGRDAGCGPGSLAGQWQ